MKKIAVLFVSIWLMTMAVIAQTPQAFKYQAVARNSTGNLIQNQLVAFRISILQGSPSGTLLYQERHTTNTNNYGLANLNIGNGTVLSGIFSSIDWSLGQMYIKVELDPLGGTVYQNMGTTQLLSVPFALHSNSSTGLTLPFDGTALTAEVGSSALKVSNSGTNQVVAIIGHATATTGDSRGVYGRSDAPDGRGVQGYASNTTGSAFGVAGFTNSNDAAGVYGSAFSSTGAAYGVEGYSGSSQGTGVYGYAGTSSGTTYGVQGRSASTSGTGVQGEASASSGATNGVTGRSFSTSGSGVFGTASATSGYTHGVFGSTLSPDGRAVGARSISTTGTTYGIHSQVLSSDGFSGYFTGGKFYVSGNVGIGTETPEYRLDVYAPYGSVSTGIAVFKNFAGDQKVQIRQNSNGAGAVYVYKTGGVQTIALLGEGDSYINGGGLGIGTTAPTQALHVVGNIRVSAIGSGAYWGPVNRTFDGTFTTSTSDIRLKENVKTINGGLNKVMQLRGVTFTWKSNPEYGNRIGFIAQELEQVLPELVFTNDVDGYKGINYAEVTAVLVEAIKDLKTENDRMKAENEKMNARIERLEASMNLNAGK